MTQRRMAIQGGDLDTDTSDSVKYRVSSESSNTLNPRHVLTDATSCLVQQPGDLFDKKACWRVCELKEFGNDAESYSKIGIFDTNAWILGEYLSRRDAVIDAARELLGLLKRVQQSLTVSLHLLGREGGKFCDNTNKSGSVWIPPSSNGVASSSKHGAVPIGAGQKAAREITEAFRKRFGSEWRFEDCVACVSDLKKCRRQLVLEICFLVFRGNARTVKEREECIEAMETAADVCRSNMCFQAWMSMAELRKGIITCVNAMNKQMDLKLVGEAFNGWKSWASARAVLRRRGKVAQRGYERMILSASMRHWKIFMCSNALDDVQRYICDAWWSDISLYKLFSTWKTVARRRRVLRDRLHCYSQELAMPQRNTNITDTMLGENTFGNFVVGLRSKYGDAKQSMQKLLALRTEPVVLRWKHVPFAELPKMYSPQKYQDTTQYDDESMDVCVSLLRCQERDMALQANLSCLVQDVNENRELFYLMKKKYEYLSNKVSEYSETIEDIEKTRLRFEQQLEIAREEAAARDCELSDANDMLAKLQSLLTSISHSVNVANENVRKHTRDVEKTHADIAMWTARVESCNARALQKDRDSAVLLKLKESKEQLRKAEIELYNLNQMEDSLLFTKHDAARAEAELKFEIERIKAKHEAILSDTRRATKSEIDRIQEHLIALESEKSSLLPKLEHFSRNLEASNKSVKTIINQISATEQRISETRAKIEMNQRMHKQIISVRKEKVTRTNHQSTIKYNSLSQKRTMHPVAQSDQEEVNKMNQAVVASHDTCHSECDDENDDDLGTFSSASFLARLLHKAFAHWKMEADDAKMRSNLAEERYTTSYLFTAVSGWRAFTKSQKYKDLHRIDCFRLIRALQSWMRYKRQRQVQNAIVSKHLDTKTRYVLA